MDTSNNSLSQPTAMTMDTDIHNLYAVSIVSNDKVKDFLYTIRLKNLICINTIGIKFNSVIKHSSFVQTVCCIQSLFVCYLKHRHTRLCILR